MRLFSVLPIKFYCVERQKILLFFIYGSVIFVAQTKAEGSVGVTGMPLWIIYLAPLVGFALNLIRDIQMFIKTIKSSEEVSVS